MTNPLWAIAGLLTITSLLINTFALTYIAHKKIEEIELLLNNCDFVKGNTAIYSHAGLPGKAIRLCMIAGMLSTPIFYIRRKLANPSDIKNFPRRTRQILLFFWYYLLTSTLSLIILGSIVKYLDPQ
ncbi:hypothetical protein [Pseudomonas sp. MN1F]|uniref:hypothetical protein n=1 Tax=Pseudomonas sp. MN1F TaxID=1366632 RepID=UPI0012C341FF|nr:hypothetical protein [Pseudomonas sp. MN1F]MQG93598.1 hypothetical protein [Pseudomonas sp. MN1F]